MIACVKPLSDLGEQLVDGLGRIELANGALWIERAYRTGLVLVSLGASSEILGSVMPTLLHQSQPREKHFLN